MKQRVLITGGSGFLGYHLLQEAVLEGYEVFAAVRKSSNTAHLNNLPVQFTEINYEDEAALIEAIAENEYKFIIHAAGVTRADTEAAYDKINAGYTEVLAKAAAALNGQVERFVLISSLAATGPVGYHQNLITEAEQGTPVTAYGRSKLKAEQCLQHIQVPYTIIRPTAIYGPRDKDLFLISRSISRGIDAYIGKIPQQLSFVHAADVAAAVMAALRLNRQNHLYNITDGALYGRYDFADITKKLLGKKALRLHLPVGLVKSALLLAETVAKLKNKVPVVNREKLAELMAENWGCDISLAKAELEFNPRFNLESGLADTIAWYKANKWV
ncbi:MAG TPA: NAD-dependent epimerase/dehydratase family protein [Ferruginibacter sp.]|nr:NAD-dependent epimerase/dehydratase family protein [Ferruginibacter sp.]HMP21793.1 NAD-dependent epimerase/dehydratase family protein [Ferruginibacter sp.]